MRLNTIQALCINAVTLTEALTSVTFPKVTLAQGGCRSKIVGFNGLAIKSYNNVGMRVFFIILRLSRNF